MAAVLYAWAERLIFAIYLLTLNMLYSGYIFRVKGVKQFSLFLLCTLPKIKELDAETPWFSISNTWERYLSKDYVHLLAQYQMVWPAVAILWSLFFCTNSLYNWELEIASFHAITTDKKEMVSFLPTMFIAWKTGKQF